MYDFEISVFVGTPENIAYDILAASIVQLSWDARNDFINATENDFYDILVNGLSYTTVKADRPSIFSFQNLRSATTSV